MTKHLLPTTTALSKGMCGLLLAAIFTLGALCPVRATDITVTSTSDNLTTNGDCSLREAIEAMNARTPVDGCPAGDGDDVILIPDGVYSLQLAGAGEDNNQTGDLDIMADASLIGRGAGSTAISGEDLDRLFQVHISVTVAISGVSFVHGHAPDGVDAGEVGDRNGEPGGGILNEGVLHLVACALRDNQAGRGGYGGDGGDGGDGGNGGAIYNLGLLHVIRSQIDGNAAGRAGGYDSSLDPFGSDGRGGYGGGIANQGMLSVQMSRIAANRALSGGGLHSVGSANVLSSTIELNASWAEGGGFSPPGGSGSSSGPGGGVTNHGTLTVTQSSIIHNRTENGGSYLDGGSHAYGGRSGDGGGIINYSVLTVTQSTISGNSTGHGGVSTFGGSSGSGGGIANLSSLTLENVTIADNTVGGAEPGEWGDGQPGAGGGLYAAFGKSVGIRNTIIATNHITATANDCHGLIESHDYNLIQTLTNCSLVGATDHNLLAVDPQILPLDVHGGPTQTNGMGFYGPSVDAGSCIDINGRPIAVDQRGIPRPVGSGCNIGAVEVLPPTDFAYLPSIRK